MHDNNVAHRFVAFTEQHIYASNITISDCTTGNLMLDPSNMYPESFHPAKMNRSKDFRRKAKWYSRTRRPTKYFLIDFGLSRRHDPANGPPLYKPYKGGDKSAPEHQDAERFCDPFPTDVYYLGNLVREEYIQVRVISLLLPCHPDMQF